MLWGVGSLLLGPVLLVYVVLNWSENMKPFLYYVGGVILMIMGAAMMAPPDVATTLPPPQ